MGAPLKEFLSNRTIKYENSVVLQEALEFHYMHQIGGEKADDDDLQLPL